jgi:hypothetical protein
MARRAYPKKSEEERRIVVSFSLSDDRLKWFREMIALETGHEPTVEQCREAARDIAQFAIDEQIKRRIEFNEVIIL